MKIYAFLRKIIKLPRPNEIWGNQVENKWNALTGYLYFKYVFSNGSAQIYGFWNVIQTSLLFYVAFTRPIFAVMISVLGIAGFLILGHILVVIGFVKKENTLGNSQNQELMEIKKIVEEIRDRK